ncbi:MAG: glycosyltransferase [Bacteroidales bacterium]|nr:glycosyltransferase [Bacteroidales bacterium]
MKYSIIVATYNRADEIRELLDSALQLEFDPTKFELIIVDDGSTDNTFEIVQEYQDKVPFSLKYIVQNHEGPGSARNRGMQEAQGEYFLFVDSDVILPSQWLKKIDEYLQINPVDAFGGPDTDHPSFPPLLKAINYAMTSFIGTAGTRGSRRSLQKKFYPRSFNMGISRKVWKSIGGMSSLRHGQDMDYSARIYEHGFRVGLIADAYVYHKRRTSWKKFFKQIFNWGVARINLWKRHKSMLKWIHLIPASFVLLVFVTAIVSIFFWWGKFFLYFLLLLILFILSVAMIESFFRYHSVKISIMSVLAIFIQISAYGLGTLTGFFQILTGKKEAQGFVKNYYR